MAPPSTETSYLPDEDEGAPPPPRRKGRVLPLLVAVCALGGFAAIVWYAYSWGTGEVPSGELPVVTAEQDLNDVKERPEEPGGMEVPHQDAQVLNDRDGGETSAASEDGQFERLLPPPESPQPPDPLEAPVAEAPADTAAPAADAEDQQAAAMDDLPSDPPAPPQIGQATEPTADTPSAEGEAEVPVPDAPAGETADTQAADAPAEDSPAAQSPPADGDQPAPEETVEVTEQPVVPPQAEASPPSNEQASPPAATADQAPPPAQAAPAANEGSVQSGDWVLQMAALRDRAAVDAEWTRLQAKHPDLLGNLNLAVQTVAVEGQGSFHRLQAGPLPNRATATDLCGLLQGSGTDCLVKQH